MPIYDHYINFKSHLTDTFKCDWDEFKLTAYTHLNSDKSIHSNTLSEGIMIYLRITLTLFICDKRTNDNYATDKTSLPKREN